jgi:hypothetical protein
VDQVEYGGWKNNLRLSNGDAELLVTLDVGPRILSYRLAGGKNVFKEFPEQLGRTGEIDWQVRGGHRLWVGPEDLTRTYAPDNGPVRCLELGPGQVRLSPPPETAHGIQKEIDLHLAAQGSRVTIVHRITNVGQEPAELAPWALTVMAPGGVAIIPLPPKRPHPGPPANASSPREYWPNQSLVLWPFTDLADPRYSFGSKYITLRQSSQRGPTKIGLAHRMGWVGYLNEGMLFLKRFRYQEGEPYPDIGCNFEMFTNEDMLEVESLGPLVRLGPDKTVELKEEWELVGGVPAVKDEASIEAHVLSRVSTP